MNQSLPNPHLITEAGSITCYHCGLPVLAPGGFTLTDPRGIREFCCAGCQAITEMIEQGGFERYYRLREAPGQKPDENHQDIFSVYDRPDMQSGWMTKDGDHCGAEILIDGITCAACIWLIESWLQKLPGIHSAYVNLSNHRLTVEWSGQALKVSDILRQLYSIGYHAKPYSRAEHQSLLHKQSRAMLTRLGLAAAFGMQVMVISIALYSGDWFGIEPGIEKFLERVSLLLVIPVLVYSAKPFFQGAYRGLKTRSPGMDLPVSVGLLLAFAGSVWATVTGAGETYYDSIVMFVFFLLGARFIELSARIKGSRSMDLLASAMPEVANKLDNMDATHSYRTIPIAEIKKQDLILVKPGERVPVDGKLVSGTSYFDESLLTGEHLPITRKANDTVLSGSVNIEQPVVIRVSHDPENTTLSSILNLANKASQVKAHITALSEKVAGWFVLGVLAIAAIIASVGLFNDSATWLTTTIAVLVVTCPCALSLATPLAQTASMNALMSQGMCVASQHALEHFAKVDHVVFDKTGTLTKGVLDITRIQTYGEQSQPTCIKLAAALEQYSNHPIACAITERNHYSTLPMVVEAEHIPGMGVRGTVEAQQYFVGSLKLMTRFAPDILQNPVFSDHIERQETTSNPAVYLFSSERLLASFELKDQIKAGAKELVNYFDRQNIAVSLYSGDREEPVKELATSLGIGQYQHSCLPEDKLQNLNQLVADGATVAMVGDGINDAPALSKAHVAIAVAKDVNLAAANADLILLNENIAALTHSHRVSKNTRRIIKQNIFWALFYNICAIPAAILGFVPPWLAAIGMSLSSILVVLNSSRLQRATGALTLTTTSSDR